MKYDAISTPVPRRKNRRLFFENVKENAKVRIPIAIPR